MRKAKRFIWRPNKKIRSKNKQFLNRICRSNSRSMRATLLVQFCKDGGNLRLYLGVLLLERLNLLCLRADFLGLCRVVVFHCITIQCIDTGVDLGNILSILLDVGIQGSKVRRKGSCFVNVIKCSYKSCCYRKCQSYD